MIALTVIGAVSPGDGAKPHGRAAQVAIAGLALVSGAVSHDVTPAALIGGLALLSIVQLPLATRRRTRVSRVDEIEARGPAPG
jgi:hypothetical protein